jgi:hypothetical protein
MFLLMIFICALMTLGKIVSWRAFLGMQRLIQVRTCDGIVRFANALVPLTLVGFQGNTRFLLQQ